MSDNVHTLADRTLVGKRPLHEGGGVSTSDVPVSEDLDPCCLSETQADRLLAGARWRRFAAIGDSLAAGVGDRVPGYAAGPWAERVAGALTRQTPGLRYVNTGRIGATNAETLSEQAHVIGELAPDLLFIPNGANDLWRKRFDPARIEEDLRVLFETATAESAGRSADVITFTLGRAFVVPTIEDFPQRVRWLNDRVRDVAESTGVTVVEMWSHPIMCRPNLLSADGIHFSSMGQAVMASEVIKSLGALLGNT